MLHIHLRFYEELNAFIPQKFRKKRFQHILNVQTSVKDLIESFNVPHTQVDMILVNQKQTGFSYVVKDHDDISVFPYFHSFDVKGISHVAHLLPENRHFVVDNHLGHLARDLRMIGCDTLYNESWNQPALIEIANSQERILLTKDRDILKRKDLTCGYFVYAEGDDEQLAEIIHHFGLADRISFLSRCLECNTPLIATTKEDVMDRLPQKVKEQHSHFTLCPNCNKVFWKGTHYKRMLQRIENILQNTINNEKFEHVFLR